MVRIEILGIYKACLFENFGTFQKKIFENFGIFYSFPLEIGFLQLSYHTWPTPSGKHNYEIDFLLSRKAKICPIEVKSSTSNLHVSIDEFQKKFSARIQQRYILHSKDIRKEQDLILLPMYMSMFLQNHFHYQILVRKVKGIDEHNERQYSDNYIELFEHNHIGQLQEVVI